MRAIALALLMMFPAFVWAEQPQPKGGGLDALAGGEKVPIEIAAQRLEAGQTSARFDEKVIVKRGEVTLTCDHLEAEYESSNRELKGLRAWGNVRILHRESLATGTEAIYNREADRAELTGDPVIYQGENSIRGKKIIFRFGRSVFEVIQPKAEFTPPEKNDKAED